MNRVLGTPGRVPTMCLAWDTHGPPTGIALPPHWLSETFQAIQLDGFPPPILLNFTATLLLYQGSDMHILKETPRISRIHSFQHVMEAVAHHQQTSQLDSKTHL